MRTPAQGLSDLFDALATLMAEVNPADQDAHNAEIAKVKDQITQAKADLAAEDTRIAAERAALDAQAYRIMLDQSALNEVLKRRTDLACLRFMKLEISLTPQEQEPVIRWRETRRKLRGPARRLIPI